MSSIKNRVASVFMALVLACTSVLAMLPMDNAYAVTRSEIVARAQECVGKPYGWNQAGPDAYAANGLVCYAVTGEHSINGVASSFKSWEETTDPQPGDIVTNGSACGVYIGEGQIITAEMGQGVIQRAVYPNMTYHKAPGLTDAVAGHVFVNTQPEAYQIAKCYALDQDGVTKNLVGYAPNGDQSKFVGKTSDEIIAAYSGDISAVPDDQFGRILILNPGDEPVTMESFSDPAADIQTIIQHASSQTKATVKIKTLVAATE